MSDDEITTTRLAMLALKVIRGNPFGVDCQHPAEALEHVDIIDGWMCRLCGVHTSDEQLVRAIRYGTPPSVWRGTVPTPAWQGTR